MYSQGASLHLQDGPCHEGIYILRTEKKMKWFLFFFKKRNWDKKETQAYLQSQRHWSLGGLKYDQSRDLAYKPRDHMQCIESHVSEGRGWFHRELTNRQSRVETLELKMGTLYTWMSKIKLCYGTKVNILTGSQSFYTHFS